MNSDYVQKVLVAAAVWLGLSIAALLIYFSSAILLVLFAGLLFAVVLRAPSRWLSTKSGVKLEWCLAATLILLLVLVSLSVILAAPAVAREATALRENLPQAFESIVTQIDQYALGRRLINETQSFMVDNGGREVFIERAFGAASSAIGALVGGLIIFFVGAYLASSPQLYIEGMVKLFPLRKRKRLRKVFYSVGNALEQWLLSRFIAMWCVGILTGVGLWILEIPFALALGVLAALLDFIPNIGPVIAAVPAILLALSQDFTLAIYVTLLYTAVQQIESYLITPILQHKMVHLPPGLTIAAQIVMGLLLGVLGLALATPLLAVIMVMITKLYVVDVLGDDEMEQEFV